MGEPEQPRGVEWGASLSFRSRGQVLRDLVIAIVAVLGGLALVVRCTWPSLAGAFVTLLALVVYCVLAYYLRVRPNHDEVGLFGNPLRPAFQTNRRLVNLVATLALGRFVSVALVDGVRLLRTGKLPQDAYLQSLE